MFGKVLWRAALATTCLVPLAALAEDFGIDEAPGPSPAKLPVPMNEAGIDLGYQWGGSAAFNRFSGATGSGPLAGGWFHLQQRSTGAEDGTFFLKADGDNVDFRSGELPPDASAALRLGQQGIWDARLHYDGIPFRQSDNYHTLNGSSGQLLNGLSAASVSTGTTTATAAAGVARMNQYLSPVDVGTRRDRVGGDLSYAGLENWRLSTKVNHEHKQGTKINSVMFNGNNNDNFASVLEPVNYDSDRFTATAAYTTRPLQAQVSYILSSFTDNIAQLVLQTPFNAAPRPGYPGTQYSLPPSNSEHRVKAQFGVNASETTRIAVNLSYGLQLQNEAFQARYYEGASRLSDTTYDGLIQTLYGNVVLTSRPLTDWNVRAAYTADDRDNSSPSYWQTPPFRGDSTGAYNGNGGIHVNPAYSFFNQKGDVELGYRLGKSTKLIVDGTYRNSLRSDAVANRNQEVTIGGRVQSTLAPGTTGMLGYWHSVREATTFLGNRGWTETGRTVATETDLKIFSYAARDRDEVKGNLNATFGESLSLGTTARWIEDRFPHTYFGITNNHILSLGTDASYSPVGGVTTHLYYTFLENFTGMMINATTAGTAWTLRNTDSTHSLGAGAQWQVTDDLKLSLDNVVTYGSTSFEEGSLWRGAGTASSANIATSLPDARSLFNTLKLAGEYKVGDGLFLGLTGLWERYSSKDYLNTQAAASTGNTTTATVLLPGEGNPGYSAGMIVASARMLW